MQVKFAESEVGNLDVKQPLTISGQIKKLRSRGLIIEDRDCAYRALESINYFRLVHYFAVFLDENGEQYIEGTRFEDGLRLYDFDRKLRTEILMALEEIEIAFRAVVSNYHSVKYKALGYLNEDSFDRRHNHRMFINKIERMMDKNADLSFVRHHNKKYGGKLPLWVMMEMFSFGMLVFFFQDLKQLDKKEIAKHYYDLDYRHIESWLDYLADLRNHCAHYNRVYGNSLPDGLRKIEIPNKLGYEMSDTVFDYLLVIKLLHKRCDVWGRSLVLNMEKLFYEFSDVVDREVLGFPENWREFF
jgi:abortive infection bacteriophage resistance protein